MGRRAGIPNKAAGAIKELAKGYGPAAIVRLADLAGLGSPDAVATSEATQVYAIRELLDRGYGKAAQPLVGEDGKALFPRLTVIFENRRIGREPEPLGVTFDGESSES